MPFFPEQNFRIVVALGLGTLPVAYSFAQAANEVEVVSDPRPIAQAADLWELRAGIPVSYEDAVYTYAGDLIDETDRAYRAAHPDFAALIPRGGRLDITLVPRTATIMSGAIQSSLQAVLDEHAALDYPGRFRLLPIATGGFIIVPTAVKDHNGVLTPGGSPLDLPITLSSSQMSVAEALTALCRAITDASRKTVVVGTIPKDLYGQTVQLRANSETARTVLGRLLYETQWADARNKGHLAKMSWRLFYGPSLTEAVYALNVHQVFVETSSPNGTIVKSLVNR